MAQREGHRLGQLCGPGAGVGTVTPLGLPPRQRERPRTRALAGTINVRLGLHFVGAAAQQALQLKLPLRHVTLPLQAHIAQLQCSGLLGAWPGCRHRGHAPLRHAQLRLQRHGGHLGLGCSRASGQPTGLLQLALQPLPAARPAGIELRLPAQTPLRQQSHLAGQAIPPVVRALGFVELHLQLALAFTRA